MLLKGYWNGGVDLYYGVMLVGAFFSVLNKRTFFYIFAAALMVMAFLRYGVGADFFAYHYLFDRLQSSAILELKNGLDSQEVGFRVIGAFLKDIGFSYQMYIAFFAAINLIFVVKTVKKFSKNPTLSLVIYFSFYYLVWTFSGVRQGVVLAVGIYYLLRAIKKNKVLKLFIVTALLSLIHTSAWFLLVLYFVSKLKFSRKHLLIITIVSVSVSVIPLGLLVSKMPWLPFYSEFARYIPETAGVNMFDFQSLGRVFFLLVAFYYYNQYVEKSDFSRKIMSVYIIALNLYFIFQFSELVASRLSIYGMYLNIIILANIIYLYKTSTTKIIYLYCLMIFCFAFLFKNLESLEHHFCETEEENIITPYVNVYNKENFSFKGNYLLLPEEWRESLRK